MLIKRTFILELPGVVVESDIKVTTVVVSVKLVEFVLLFLSVETELSKVAGPWKELPNEVVIVEAVSAFDRIDEELFVVDVFDVVVVSYGSINFGDRVSVEEAVKIVVLEAFELVLFDCTNEELFIVDIVEKFEVVSVACSNSVISFESIAVVLIKVSKPSGEITLEVIVTFGAFELVLFVCTDEELFIFDIVEKIEVVSFACSNSVISFESLVVVLIKVSKPSGEVTLKVIATSGAFELVLFNCINDDLSKLKVTWLFIAFSESMVLFGSVDVEVTAVCASSEEVAVELIIIPSGDAVTEIASGSIAFALVLFDCINVS